MDRGRLLGGAAASKPDGFVRQRDMTDKEVGEFKEAFERRLSDATGAVHVPQAGDPDPEDNFFAEHNQRQMELQNPAATEAADAASQLEAQRGLTYINARIASGSTLIQVVQGMSMAMAEMIGIMVQNEHHDDMITALVMIMGQQAEMARRRKAAKTLELAMQQAEK